MAWAPRWGIDLGELDRGVANYEWLSKFPTGRVRYLNCFTSDHRPILVSLVTGGEK